jgi:signal transduction histidine kinase
MRNLSHHLYPPLLRYAGIVPALKTLATDFEKTPRFKVDLVLPQEPLTLPNVVQLCIFRIAQECLQNTVKHSGADKARVLLEGNGERIRLMVSDSGRGFSTVDVARNCGLGLLSMEERAISIGGRLAVKSSPGHGTEICLTIPIQGNESFNDQVPVDLGNSQVTRHSAEF